MLRQRRDHRPEIEAPALQIVARADNRDDPYRRRDQRSPPIAAPRSSRTDRWSLARILPAPAAAGSARCATARACRAGATDRKTAARPPPPRARSATSIVAWRPPYERPPRHTCPDTRARIASTALRKPSRSAAAVAGEGGPVGRRWRNGRSQRSTCQPRPAKASAAAISSAERQLPPAPWVSTNPGAPALSGRCRKPRMPGLWDAITCTTLAAYCVGHPRRHLPRPYNSRSR